MKREKLALLTSILLRRPLEVVDRIANKCEVWADRFSSTYAYPVSDLGDFLEKAARCLGHESGELYVGSLQAATRSVQETLMRAPDVSFAPSLSADPSLARVCYALCRLLCPQVVVETGVAHGVTSAYVLHALDENGSGMLHSIDLPPLAWDADSKAGRAVAAALRTRWCFHRGMTRRLLKPLLEDVGQVDLFIHDSLHTYRTMRYEMDLVWPKLRRPAAVIADDVHGNEAFKHFVTATRPGLWAVIKQENKSGLFGVAIYP
jgi:hypothetical protein